MSKGSRRFTDREVALVLQRATDLDEPEGVEPGAGLSLEDLTEIAREVGISPAAIERAVASLDRRRVTPGRWTGAPAVRKAVHGVPVSLDRDGVARLMGVVDDRVETTGAITEALGSYRWTGSDRFKSTRVSVTPRDGETTIEVVEKSEPRLKRIIHLIPAAWGLMIAPAFIEMNVLPASGILLAAVLAAGLGAGVGRVAWSLLSAASNRRVRRLAEGLALEAVGASSDDEPPRDST